MDICGQNDFFSLSLDFGRKFGHLRFFFALHLMRDCIYVFLMARNMEVGNLVTYVELQSG